MRGEPIVVDDSMTGSFDAFYRLRWPETARLATVLSGDAASGDDIAQEAMLRISSRFAHLDKPEAYLRRTVVNLAGEQHRSDSRRVRREGRVARLTTAPDRGQTGDALDSDMLRALGELPAPQRMVLSLRYWADWTEEDIADVLGCRRSTVRSHAKRGLDRLRAALEEET